MNICPVKGCKEPTRRSQFMCRRHWYQAPRFLRWAVNDAWRHFRAVASGDSGRPLEERLAAVAALREARKQCLQAVEEKAGQ